MHDLRKQIFVRSVCMVTQNKSQAPVKSSHQETCWIQGTALSCLICIKSLLMFVHHASRTACVDLSLRFLIIYHACHARVNNTFAHKDNHEAINSTATDGLDYLFTPDRLTVATLLYTSRAQSFCLPSACCIVTWEDTECGHHRHCGVEVACTL